MRVHLPTTMIFCSRQIFYMHSSSAVSTYAYGHFAYNNAFCWSRRVFWLFIMIVARFFLQFEVLTRLCGDVTQILFDWIITQLSYVANCWAVTGLTWEWHQGLHHQQQWKQIITRVLLYNSVRDCCDSSHCSSIDSLGGTVYKVFHQDYQSIFRKGMTSLFCLIVKMTRKWQNSQKIFIFLQWRWLQFQKMLFNNFSLSYQSTRVNTIQ